MHDEINKIKQNLKELTLLEGFTRVEDQIQVAFHSDAELLKKIPQYLFSLGGKRIRPILTLLTGKACGQALASSDLIKVSAGIELIHMATLMHDDIIDNSPLRRNRPTAHLEFGLGNTLLAGDFLLIRAFGLCGQLDKQIVAETEIACAELTEGEILEVPLDQGVHTIESSINIARKKTAALFRLSAFCGSSLAGASPTCCQHFKNFGENLGIAFQILDDLLDVTADEVKLGKPIGTDFREKKPSVVNVLWLATGTPLAKQLTQSPAINPATFVAPALAEIRALGIIEKTQNLAEEYSQAAYNSLNLALNTAPIAVEEYAQMLKNLIVLTTSRNS